MPNSAIKSSTASTPNARVSLIAAGVVLILCLVLGGGFIWWFLRGAGQPQRVTFTADEVANMQTAGRQMTLGNAPGASLQVGGNGPLQLTLRTAARTAPEPDDVATVGSYTVIHAGQVLVRVQPPAAAGQPTVLLFRQRTWGLLADQPTFTIARRIVHEPSLAKQLAVTPDQLQKLSGLVAQPALKGEYLSALPVPETDQANAVKAWTDYVAAMASKDANAKMQATTALLQIARSAGSVALAKAKTDYADADNIIKQVLTSTQIDAYHQNKTLTP